MCETRSGREAGGDAIPDDPKNGSGVIDVTLTRQFHSDENHTSTSRHRWPIAVLLLVLTIAGGVAARMSALPAAGKTGAPLGQGLEFGAQGAGPVHFQGRLDRGSVMAGGDGLVNMELIIRGDEPRDRALVRAPTDLVGRVGSVRVHAR